MKKIYIVIISVFAFILFVTILFKFYSPVTFFGALFYGIVFISCYVFVMMDYKRREEETKHKLEQRKTFSWCWGRVNTHLKDMTGGDGLNWDGGFGKHSEVRSMHDGKKICSYRSLTGLLSEQQQLVVIIYNVDDDDIAKYYANPSSEVIQNPFHGFKPFVGNQQPSFGYPSHHRTNSGRTTINRRYNLNNNVPNNPNEAVFEDMPRTIPDDYVEEALGKLEN